MGVPCHGVAKGVSVASLTPNTTLKASTVAGAGHGGGHCAWFLSTDEKKWYKISDTADCTSDSVDGQRDDFVVPANAPVECKQGCTLAWFWSPRFSGACETYINCFDVTIPAATGGMQSVAPSITTPIQDCARVDTTTHFTPMFGTLAVAGKTPVDTGCTTYTVKAGDTLSKIATLFDIEGGYTSIYNLNKDVMTDENTIEIGQVLKMPGGDCQSPNAGDTTTNAQGTTQAGNLNTESNNDQVSSSQPLQSTTTPATSPDEVAIAACNAVQTVYSYGQFTETQKESGCNAIDKCVYVQGGSCAPDPLESSSPSTSSAASMSGAAIALLILWLITMAIVCFLVYKVMVTKKPSSSQPSSLSQYEQGHMLANPIDVENGNEATPTPIPTPRPPMPTHKVTPRPPMPAHKAISV